MKLAIDIIAIYGLYACSAAILIGRFSKSDRAVTVILACLVPFLAIAACFWGTFSLIVHRRPAFSEPCPHGLEDAELLVAKHRKEMFGGALNPTHFALDWKRYYQAALAAEATGVQRIARKMLAYA